jgi:hypothetical protein
MVHAEDKSTAAGRTAATAREHLHRHYRCDQAKKDSKENTPN